MSLETELQNVIAATSALNQTVQGKIDAINNTVNAAVATNDARATSAISSVTSAVNAELGNIRPYSTNYVFWNTLKPADRIRIFPAMVIGQVHRSRQSLPPAAHHLPHRDGRLDSHLWRFDRHQPRHARRRYRGQHSRAERRRPLEPTGPGHGHPTPWRTGRDRLRG